jgi:hypothetical protein
VSAAGWAFARESIFSFWSESAWARSPFEMLSNSAAVITRSTGTGVESGS